MTNWILISVLGLGAYYYLNRSVETKLGGLPVSKPMPIALQESSRPGVYDVPTYVVKKYGTPDQTTADTLYLPAPVFSTQPVGFDLF